MEYYLQNAYCSSVISYTPLNVLQIYICIIYSRGKYFYTIIKQRTFLCVLHKLLCCILNVCELSDCFRNQKLADASAHY